MPPKKTAINDTAASIKTVADVVEKARIRQPLQANWCYGDFCRPSERGKVVRGDRQLFTVLNKSIIQQRLEKLHAAGGKHSPGVSKMLFSDSNLLSNELAKLDPNYYYMELTVCEHCFSRYTAMDQVRRENANQSEAMTLPARMFTEPESDDTKIQRLLDQLTRILLNDPVSVELRDRVELVCLVAPLPIPNPN